MDKVLPKGWVETNLGEIIKISSGKNLTKKKMVEDGNYPVYGGNGITGNHNAFVVENPTIIIGRVGFYCGSVHLSESKAWITDNAFITSFSEKNINKKFLFQYLKFLDLGKFSNSSAQPVISGKVVYPIRINLPPLPEQQRIVQKLDALLGNIKTAQARLDKIPPILKRFRQSVLAKAVSGKLTEEWRINEKTIWQQTNINTISSLVTKGASPKWQGINYVNSYNDNSILFMTSENVGNFRIIQSKFKYIEIGFNQKQKKSILNKGDVLTNIVGGSIGRTTVWNLNYRANINQAVCLIRPISSLCLSKYLEIYLNSSIGLEALFQNIVDVARANVSLSTIKEIKISLPPIQEQKEIVRQVEALFEVADRIEVRYQSIKAKMETLPQSILAKAFRGELVPQDPNDEPASVLLERIKAEKGGLQKVGKKKGKKRLVA